VEFDAYVTTRSRDLLRTAWLLTGDWALAEDLVQTALASCWPRWSSISSPDAYVRRAILRAFLSWRRRGSSGERPVSVVPEASAPDAVEPAEVRTAVRSALGALAPRERAAVVLRYYADLSVAETAAALGVSEGAVKRYASDGLAALRSSPALDGLLTTEVGT